MEYFDRGFVRKKKIPTFVIILAVLLIVYLIAYFTGIGRQEGAGYKATLSPCVGAWTFDREKTEKRLKQAASVGEIFGEGFSVDGARLTVDETGAVLFQPGDGSRIAGQAAESAEGVSGRLDTEGAGEAILLWARDDVLILNLRGENTYWTRAD